MDILIFAAIAVFIFFKLFEQFGKVDEEQKRDSIKNFIKEKTKTSDSSNTANPDDNQPRLVAIPGVGIVENNPSQVIVLDEKSQKILEGLSGDLRTNLLIILGQNSLSPSQFVEGAKSAFEIILSAFAIGDLATLKPLISEKIFLQFEADIQNRKSVNQSLNIKIISIDESKITSAKMIENFAHITVNFVSKQINYIVSEKDEIIFGSKTEISTVNDVWTFKKDCNSLDPNWLLVATS